MLVLASRDTDRTVVKDDPLCTNEHRVLLVEDASQAIRELEYAARHAATGSGEPPFHVVLIGPIDLADPAHGESSPEASFMKQARASGARLYTEPQGITPAVLYRISKQHAAEGGPC